MLPNGSTSLRRPVLRGVFSGPRPSPAWGRRDGAQRPGARAVAAVDGRAPGFVTLLRDGREGSTPHEVSNRCGRALTNVRSTSTPVVPFAHKAVIHRRRGERVKSTPLRTVVGVSLDMPAN